MAGAPPNAGRVKQCGVCGHESRQPGFRPPMPEQAPGVIDHMAFTATGLQSVINTLKQHGITYRLNRMQELGIWQLFCFDPDGAKVELDFAANEPAPTE